METRSKVSGGSEPPEKSITGAAKRQSRHQKISFFFGMQGTGQQARN